MRLKLLFITVILFLGCVETYGETTIFSFTFENTKTVTSDNAVGTPTPSVSSINSHNYAISQISNSRSHADYEIDFVNFTYTFEKSNKSIPYFAFRSSVDSFGANIETPNFDDTSLIFSRKTYQNRTSATTFSINDFIFKGTVTQTSIASDYFRSKSTGVWATADNWESSSDNINWIPSTLAPTSAANAITIRNTHKITISSQVTADQITVENGGTLVLNGANLTLNDGIETDLTINNGGTFDNGGENQIISGGGTPSISITGTFITRDAQGFVGTNTAIPSVSTTLESGSTVEYGLAGNQEVQGSTAPMYQNITFSGSGIKTLASNNSVAGTVTIKDAVILDVGNHTFGGTYTNLTMSGSTRLIISGTGTKPDIGGVYTLSGGVMEFANNSTTTQTIRNKAYQNIEITGNNVGNSSGNITINDNGTFTVKNSGVFTINDKAIVGSTGTQTLTVENGGTFRTGDTDGFNGGTTTSVRSNVENINLHRGSTVEYSKDANQTITLANYSNLTVSGTTGIKTLASNTDTVVGNNLTIKNGATLKVESGKTITVTNNVLIDPTAIMSLENSSSLVQINNNATNSGKITYKRNTSLGRETDYTYWSTPVADQTLLDVSPLTKKDKFFSFNPAINNWTQEDTTLKMTLGKGYIIRGIPAPSGSTSPRFYTAPFYGKPNNGIINVPIIWDGSPTNGSSNLIGNPYPSAIDADAFLLSNENVIEGTLYFWTHNTDLQLREAIIASGATPGTGALAYTSDDYATYNSTGGTAGSGKSAISDSNLSSPGADLAKIPNGKIAAGQAFFTTSLKTNPISQAIFNNSMRLDKDSKVLNNAQFFKTKNSKTEKTIFEKHRIWLNLTNTQGAFKQTLVGYITDATNEYDPRFDGESFDGNKFIDFYSLNKEKKLVIQGRALPFDEIDEVPLGFKTVIHGTFTINIDQADGVLTNQAVFIEDKLTHTIADLRSAPFTFNTTAGTFNNRFVLRYINNTLKTKELGILENKVLVSNKNKQLKVNSKVEPIDKVMVYDLMGRLVFEKDKINSTEFSILNSISKSETLLVKVTLQNGETVTRKILY
jgi:hypothetical protein